MMKLAKACFIAAVAAVATLSTMAESTATTLQTEQKAIAAEKAARDAESAKIVQRMKAMCLPEVAFAPPATIVDAMEFFRVASKDYDSAEIPVEVRGFSFILRTGDDAPVIPMLKASNISLYDAMKLVCDSVGYTFYADGGLVFVMSKKEYARMKQDMEKDEIVQRMKDMCLPEVAFEPPKTIADAVKFFYEASKKYDSAEVPVEKRGFNMLLQTGGADAPVIPMFRLKNVSFYNALKFVCSCVGYEFDVSYESNLSDVIVTIKPCDSSATSD